MAKRLFWRICLPQLFLIFLCTGAVGLYSVYSIREFYESDVAHVLESEARLVSAQLLEGLEAGRWSDLDGLCKRLGSAAHVRFTVILPDGRVIADSSQDPATMENHGDRYEVRQALAGRTGREVHYSRTLKSHMLYVAVPLDRNNTVVGAVRTSIQLAEIEKIVGSAYGPIIMVAAGVGALALLISLIITRRISRPLEDMRHWAERFAKGDFSIRVPMGGAEEVAGLAAVLNQMAVELDQRIQTITRQGNERQAILSSMVEGVVALDRNERILGLNQAAARLIGADLVGAEGRPLVEVIRNADLQRFVAKLKQSHSTLEEQVVLRDPVERYLQLHGTVLRDAAGRDIGALVVINDLTRIRKLETVRRDFVANVSHELRTPITSIQGFVETLQDGAIRDPEKSVQFLEIVAAQAERLNKIIEDLLQLSRLEQDEEKARLEVTDSDVRAVVDAAIAACQSKASDNQVALNVACPTGLRATINAPLIERAIVNLVDNAIKYSEPASTVAVEVERPADELIVRVRDSGCGIAAEHLPRLCERFYRVDKARSRKLGGTGLGLAIVKHIAQVHGGSVTIQSAPGKGSTFEIHIPLGGRQ